jgi:hypothetical protein
MLTAVIAVRDAAAPADGSPGFRDGGAAAAPVPGVAARTGGRAALPDGHEAEAKPTGEDGSAAVA